MIGLSGTKSEVPEELNKALEAAAEAQAVLRAIGDRVGRVLAPASLFERADMVSR